MNIFLEPPFLKKGDTIYLLSISKKIEISEMEFAIQWLKNEGYEVVLGKTIQNAYHQFSGTDQERQKDFQTALNDPNVKAIFFARGGYGAQRVIDLIDFRGFINQPKWLVGFSDITIVHNLVNQFYGIQTMHAPMPITMPQNTEASLKHLSQIMKGEKEPISFETSSYNKGASFEGQVIGGNLSILYSLLGTNNGVQTNDKILFIEDIDEYLYHIDRMMLSLKKAKKLEGLKGIIVGGFTDIKDNEIPFGFQIEEIILEHCKEYDYPIVFDAPIGHISNHIPIILGANIHVKQEKENTIISYI